MYWSPTSLNTFAGQDSAACETEADCHPRNPAESLPYHIVAAELENFLSIVRDQLACKFGITQEKAFMTGSGAGQPERDQHDRHVATGNGATAIGADSLINAKYALKAQYQRTATNAW